MLDFDEEIKKFKPILSVESVEDEIYSRDMTDVIDLLKEMHNSNANAKNSNTEGASE